MANAFLKSETIAATALGLLERELVLSNLVWSNSGFDFTGAKADAVTVRIPAQLNAREYDWRNDRSSDIVLDELTEDSITVQLNKDIYSAVAVTDEELSLGIEDFGSQVLQPQINAVAKAIDAGVANMIETATYSVPAITVDEKDPFPAFIDARAALNKNEVPTNDRTLLIGADVETALLKSGRLNDVSKSGSDSALRQAMVGNLAGFNLVTSNAINPLRVGVRAQCVRPGHPRTCHSGRCHQRLQPVLQRPGHGLGTRLRRRQAAGPLHREPVRRVQRHDGPGGRRQARPGPNPVPWRCRVPTSYGRCRPGRHPSADVRCEVCGAPAERLDAPP
ncbi:P22 phage major capsid protein family protein [Streptomyces noursei]|uniref:P22 phage major capsid protein family protein n=1 Tax=Streptomyces noursei TaxID=1971 RepID=UPI00332B67A2